MLSLAIANKHAIVDALHPDRLGNRTCFMPVFKVYKGTRMSGNSRCLKKVCAERNVKGLGGSKQFWTAMDQSLTDARRDVEVVAIVRAFVVNVSCNCHAADKLGEQFGGAVEAAMRFVGDHVRRFLSSPSLSLSSSSASFGTGAEGVVEAGGPPCPTENAVQNNWALGQQASSRSPANTCSTHALSTSLPTPARRAANDAASDTVAAGIDNARATTHVSSHRSANATLLLSSTLSCCGQAFDSEASLVQHCNERHLPIASLKCCGFLFTWAEWRRHYETAHRLQAWSESQDWERQIFADN